MRGVSHVFLLAAVLVAASGCGTVAAVRPLPRGASALAASLGGPVANVAGSSIPLPYTVVRYRYGLSDKAGLFAGGHLTAAALGVIGTDLGFSYHFLEQKAFVPAVGASASLLILIQPGRNEAMFPQADLTASYLWGDRYLFYFGSHSVYQLNEQPAVTLAPFVGGSLKLGRGWSLSLEGKWYAPSEPTHPRNVNYLLPIANHGAVGFALGLNFDFGGRHE